MEIKYLSAGGLLTSNLAQVRTGRRTLTWYQIVCMLTILVAFEFIISTIIGYLSGLGQNWLVNSKLVQPDAFINLVGKLLDSGTDYYLGKFGLFLSLCLQTPLIEEFTYRFILLGLTIFLINYSEPVLIKKSKGISKNGLIWSAVVFSALVFAQAHVSNYPNLIHESYSVRQALLSVTVVPQLISGVLYGYVYVRFGFQYALFAHALHNSFSILSFFYQQYA